MHWPQTPVRSVTTMDPTLIHGDDDSCHEIDRLIAEVSSELCLLGDGDLDAVIASAIARIGDAAGVDALTLVAYGDADTAARTRSAGARNSSRTAERRLDARRPRLPAACLAAVGGGGAGHDWRRPDLPARR